MAYRIKLTLRAEEEYQKNIDYIAFEFGVKKALDVEEIYFRIIQQISVNPNQFSYFNKRKGIRKCVVSPQTTLYYRFDKNVINLLSFRSNFMNPQTRNL
jgi:plasmid stabilization system protein ParE